MRKAGGEPLWLRVSIPSNKNPLLSLLLYIQRDGRLWPRNKQIKGEFHVPCSCFFHVMSKKKSKVRLWGGWSLAKNDREDQGALSQENSSEELSLRNRDALLTHRGGEWVQCIRSLSLYFILLLLLQHLDSVGPFQHACPPFFYRLWIIPYSIPPVWSIIHRLLSKVQHKPVGQRCVKVAPR